MDYAAELYSLSLRLRLDRERFDAFYKEYRERPTPVGLARLEDLVDQSGSLRRAAETRARAAMALARVAAAFPDTRRISRDDAQGTEIAPDVQDTIVAKEEVPPAVAT